MGAPIRSIATHGRSQCHEYWYLFHCISSQAPVLPAWLPGFTSAAKVLPRCPGIGGTCGVGETALSVWHLLKMYGMLTSSKAGDTWRAYEN